MSDPIAKLSREDERLLLQVARDAIEYGLRYKRAPHLEAETFPASVRVPRAVFVTLTLDGELRGCVGTMESGLPLVINVSKYAYASAFVDSRFPAVTASELPQLHIHISILSPLEQIVCCSEQELLSKIRPGIDGLLLEEGTHRATLLPSVWDSIPDPTEFVKRLKIKAGLPAHYWSNTIRMHSYTVQSIQNGS